MGSGLILLVIVGAWLAVLVPMGLRSHDAQTSLRGTERFSDAMRVLSRRPTGNERTALVPRRPAGSRTVLSAERTPTAERAPAPSFLEQFDQAPEGRVPVSLAVRRRRVLVVLLVWAALSAVAGYVGPPLLLKLAVGLLLLAALFVVHCRRQAVLKAEQHRRRAARSRAAGRPARTRT
ncbi:MAG: hypothetical protein JWL64_318, partial [Frankiales bacterium]|nr:hypothetical protein [Frankiales bacterium]